VTDPNSQAVIAKMPMRIQMDFFVVMCISSFLKIYEGKIKKAPKGIQKIPWRLRIGIPRKVYFIINSIQLK
jgi:hypothetical protein